MLCDVSQCFLDGQQKISALRQIEPNARQIIRQIKAAADRARTEILLRLLADECGEVMGRVQPRIYRPDNFIERSQQRAGLAAKIIQPMLVFCVAGGLALS